MRNQNDIDEVKRNWKLLKEALYFEDGSLRDIYILNVTKDDWYKWINHVNLNYQVTFYNGLTEQDEPTINFPVIHDYWNGIHDLCCHATLNINNIIIKAYFFDESEIENDITPNDVQSLKDHDNLRNYLQDIANLLEKQVVLTEENGKEHILLTIEPNSLTYNNQ